MQTRTHAQEGFEIKIITERDADRVSVGVRKSLPPAFESDGTDEEKYTWAHFNVKGNVR